MAPKVALGAVQAAERGNNKGCQIVFVIGRRGEVGCIVLEPTPLHPTAQLGLLTVQAHLHIA